MKSNVKIYNNSSLDTKVVGYGGSTNLIKIYHNSLDYQTGDFFNIAFSVNDSTMGGLSSTPTPDSQLGYQPVAVRFDGDKVRENDLAKWTVTATPLSGYKFSHWLLNGEKATDAESYVLRDDTTIQAVFIPATITVYFYNSPAGQWYDAPSGGTMLTSVNLQQGYYAINGIYQDSGYWYLDCQDVSTPTMEHFQWYFIPESGWSYTGLEINGDTIEFPYEFGTDDLTIVASTEQTNVLIIDSDRKNGRWVDSSGTYMASAITIPYTRIIINFRGRGTSPNSNPSLMFNIGGEANGTTFNSDYYYEYVDGYNTYLELDGTSMATSGTWSMDFNTGQHTLDARATQPLWKTYQLASNEKTAIQNFIGSTDNCLGQRYGSVFNYAYCFIRNSGLLLCIDKYDSNFMGFTIVKATTVLNKYGCGKDSKLSNLSFGDIIAFEVEGDTQKLEQALTNGGFSSIDDFCEYIMTKFNLS